MTDDWYVMDAGRPRFEPRQRTPAGGIDEHTRIALGLTEVPVEAGVGPRQVQPHVMQSQQQQQQQLRAEGRDTSRRILSRLAETEQVAASTMEELHRQGETLDRCESKMETVDAHLKQSSRFLRSIESVWGSLRNKFTSNTSYDGLAACSKAASSPGSMSSASPSSSGILRAASSSPSSSSSSPSPSPASSASSPGNHRPAATTEAEAYMAEQDEALDAMVSSLDTLRSMALDMNTEIERHNQVLGRMDVKADGLNHDVNKTNRRIWKLL